MRTTALIVPVLLAMAAGCGGNNGSGFYASGSINMTVTDPNSSTPGNVNYNFPQPTRIDPTLPMGTTMGYTGSCAVGPNGRAFHISAVGQTEPSQVDVMMPDWSQDSCTNCNHGNITVTIPNGSQQQVAFSGAENRGSGTAQCTFTAAHNGVDGMTLGVQCSALTTSGDPRSVSVNANLTLTHCTTN